MKKTNYIKDLNAIKEMAGKVRTINESLRFNENDDYFDELKGDEEVEPELDIPQEGGEECVDGECNLQKANPEDEGLKELDKGGELDKIREITLHGMIALNNTPEDPKFQALLKIFNICNKAVNENGEEESVKK